MPTATRDDVHSWNNIQPEDYEFYTAIDNSSDAPGLLTPGAVEARRKAQQLVAQSGTSVYKTTSRCDHCGAHLRYSCLYFHVPSQDYVSIGWDCVINTMDCPDRATLEILRLKKQARLDRSVLREREELDDRQSQAREDYPEAVKILEGYEGDNYFILDVASRFDHTGRLSPKQAAAIVRSYAKEQQEEERKEVAAPVPEGRIVIEGTVSKEYFKEYAMSSRHVMIVESLEGWKVWGSVPSALELPSICVGDQVRFTATVERSDSDPSFGFYKRPAKAQRIKEAK